jgi:hypothetical protein
MQKKKKKKMKCPGEKNATQKFTVDLEACSGSRQYQDSDRDPISHTTFARLAGHCQSPLPVSSVARARACTYTG